MSKVALIVGASSGVGAATARELSRRGWLVVLVARSEERLATLAKSIGANASAYPCDASSPSEVVGLEAFVRVQHGIPDVVINCAGVGEWKRLEDTTPDDLLRMIGAPYLAAANASRMFLRDMISRQQGILIHVNSPACFMPWPSSVGYAASRFALRGLHEALLQDLAGTGVKSCHVVFGHIDSPYFESNAIEMEQLPGISETIRTLTVEECATVLADVADRPTVLRVYPFVLRVYYWIHRIAPWLPRWLLRITSRTTGG
ncbi:MAG: SDR family NAD(P)-dependent oxidoreductase [Bacteroidota bacterium]